MLGVQEFKRYRKNATLNGKFTTCWTEQPGEHPGGEGVGSTPSTAHKQAMRPGNRAVETGGKLEISSQ